MSRFFANHDESSSSSEEDDSDASSEVEEEEEEVKAPAKAATGGASKASAFMKDDDDSDDDDDSKRVVRSARDKKWDNLAQTADSLKNHIKINDWNAVTADFDSLNKQLEKAKQIVAKEGVPTFYFSALIALEDAVAKALSDKAAVKKLSSTNAKSLNGMKQKLRKHCKQYEDDLARVRKEGGGGGDDAEEEAEEESESESESDDDDGFQPAKGKAAFMKKPAAPAKKPAPKAAESAPPPKPAEPKGPKKIADYNEADIDKHLDKILEGRGRKGTNKAEQITTLGQLADVTKRPSKLVELLGHVIAFSLDMHNNMLIAMPVKVRPLAAPPPNSSLAPAPLLPPDPSPPLPSSPPSQVWKEIFAVFERILATLVANPELKIEQTGGTTVVDTVQQTTAEQGDEDDEFLDGGVTQMTARPPRPAPPPSAPPPAAPLSPRPLR